MSDPIAVRFSHLLGFAGVGSIVRSEKWLYTVIDITKWPQHTYLPYVERVRLSLVIGQELHEPPKGKLGQNGRVQGATVPGIRFPSWMRCRKCGLMHWQWWNQVLLANDWPRCSQCRTSLDQFPWVMIDTDGRMDDVPWHWLLHHNGSCKEDRKNPHLRLIDNRSTVPPAPTSGMPAATSKRWTLLCQKKDCSCSARRDLDEKDAAYDNPRFLRHQPWRGDNPTKEDAEPKVHIVDVSNDERCAKRVVCGEHRESRLWGSGLQQCEFAQRSWRGELSSGDRRHRSDNSGDRFKRPAVKSSTMKGSINYE